MAVRVFDRLAEVGRDGLLQPGRNGVFERLGLRVHLAPVEPQNASEEELDESVTANDAASLGDAALGQPAPRPDS